MGRKSNYTIAKEKARQRVEQRTEFDDSMLLFDELVEKYEVTYGPLDAAALDLVMSAVFARDVELMMMRDIKTRGLVVTTHNGRQIMTHENKSVVGLRKQQDEKRKCLDALNLTPAKLHSKEARKDGAAYAEAGDDFDRF